MARAFRVLAFAVAALTACSGSSGSGSAAKPAEAVCSGAIGTGGSTCTIAGPVEVSSVAAPVAVSSIAAPVSVAGAVSVAGPVEVAPVTVQAIVEPVKVTGLEGGITVSSVSGPVTLAGTPKVVTADRDVEQLVTGTLDRAASVNTCPSNLTGTYGCRKLVDGPFVLTDVVLAGPAYASSSVRAEVVIGAASEGTYGLAANWTMRLRAVDPVDTTAYSSPSYKTSRNVVLTGGRWVVKSGESLYATVEGGAEVTWSGFRPY